MRPYAIARRHRLSAFSDLADFVRFRRVTVGCRNRFGVWFGRDGSAFSPASVPFSQARKRDSTMRIFISAGEPSGDLHGANLIAALRAASRG